MRENAAKLSGHHKQPIKADLMLLKNSITSSTSSKWTIFTILYRSNCLTAEDLHTGLPGVIKILAIRKTCRRIPVITAWPLSQGVAAENKQELKHWVKKHEFARQEQPLAVGPGNGPFSYRSENRSKGMVLAPARHHPREILCYQLGKANSNERPFQEVIHSSRSFHR